MTDTARTEVRFHLVSGKHLDAWVPSWEEIQARMAQAPPGGCLALDNPYLVLLRVDAVTHVTLLTVT